MADKKKPQSKFPDIKMMVSSFAGVPYKEIPQFLKSEKGRLFTPLPHKDFPPTFLIWGDKDYLRYEAFDFAEDLNKLGVTNQLYKADGIIGMHAWAIATIVQKGRDCLSATYAFTLPYLPNYFEKKNGEWTLKKGGN